MSRIKIYLWVCAFFGVILSAATFAEQTLEKMEPPISKNEALSRLMEGLLREKSPLPLNLNINRNTPAAKEATAKERPDSKANTPSSQAPQLPPTIAVGVIVRFKSPEIQALARNNLPPPPEVVAELEAALGEALVFERATVNEAYVFSFLAPKEGKEAIDAFLQPARELPAIDWIEANQRVQMQSSSVRAQLSMAQTQSFSNDPDFGDQWNMKGESEGYLGGIDAVHAWDITHGSPDTIVAVVDTGVLPHPEFSGRLLPGYDFVSDPYKANDGDGRDSDARDPGNWVKEGECDGVSPHNSSWHGTHVAGIIAASGDDGHGIAGVNWKTRILPVRVLGKCGGYFDDISAGITWAAGLPVPDPAVPLNPYPAQVINLSIGGLIKGECPANYQASIDGALGQGALVVVAAGNEDHDSIKDYPPANCKNIMVVVATDLNGNLVPYSNTTDFFGDNIAIAAPGGYKGKWNRVDGTYPYPENGILSTVNAGTTRPEYFSYDWMEGTSMAAPHVSGIASLMLAINPHLSGAELLLLLNDSSKPFPDTSFLCNLGSCGVGMADAYQSVIAASLLRSYRLVYEYYNEDLNHYFLTGSKEDAAIVERGGAGLGWYSTNLFYTWSGPEEGALPVCRFYTRGANSHFYTANAEDCAYLQGLNEDNIIADDKWTYEDIAFYAKLPTNGICPADSAPIYRVYNNRWMYNDSNHRFVSSESMRQVMLDKGWVDEGVAFCAAFVQDNLTFLD